MQFGLSESVAHWGRYRRNSCAVLANGSAISYGELNVAVDRLVPAVLTETTERVAVACGTKYNLLVAILAVLRAGKSIVLVNPGLAQEPLATTLSDANPRVLLHDGAVPHVEKLVPRSVNIHALDADASVAELQIPDRGPKQEWGVLYSSGTTGTPKGIERDQDSMVTEFLGWILELGLWRKTTFFIGRPIYYTGGLVLAGAVLTVGGTIVIDDLTNDNNAEEAWQSMTRMLKATSLDWVFFVPDQVRAFLKNDRLPPLPSHPTNLLVMGGPISGDEKIAAADLMGCNVIESWGNSESLGTITDAGDLHTRPNSIGRPFICDELLIVDDSLRAVPPGTPGRIAGGIEAGFTKYSNRPTETEHARRDGLIVSEDWGTQDDDGYFYILGRDSDNVIRNGTSMFLSQIEATLRADSSVQECCVTSVGGDDAARIIAIVATSASAHAGEILTRLNARLDATQRLDAVIVSEVPKLPSGKIDRIACRQMAERE